MSSMQSSAKYGNQAPIEAFWVEGFKYIRHMMSILKKDVSFQEKLIEIKNFIGWLPPITAEGFLICKNCSNFKKAIYRRKYSREYRTRKCQCKGKGNYIDVVSLVKKRYEFQIKQINEKYHNTTDRSRRIALITSQLQWVEHSLLQFLQKDIVAVMEDAGHLFWRMDDMPEMVLEETDGKQAVIKPIAQTKSKVKEKAKAVDLAKVPDAG